MLVLVVQITDELAYLVLNEWNASHADGCPHIVWASGVSTPNARYVSGDISVEPITLETSAVFAIGDAPAHNGALCVLGDGDAAIQIKVKSDHSYWSLRTGERMTLPQNQPHHWLSAWRLVWRDGDDTVTLCEIGKVSA